MLNIRCRFQTSLRLHTFPTYFCKLALHLDPTAQPLLMTSVSLPNTDTGRISRLTLCLTPILRGSSFSLFITAVGTYLPNRTGTNPSSSVTRLNNFTHTSELCHTGFCVGSISQFRSTTVLHTHCPAAAHYEQCDILQTSFILSLAKGGEKVPDKKQRRGHTDCPMS